jgi:FkbM family methyltransferase
MVNPYRSLLPATVGFDRLLSTFEELDKIPFFDWRGIELDSKELERTEQIHAYKYIEPNDVILELGGRYGMAAVYANAKLANKRNHYVVEPDSTVIEALKKNRDSHYADFQIFNGYVSKRPMKLVREENPIGLANFSVPVAGEGDAECKTLEQIKKETGLQFNTLIADCEGFLEQFFDENYPEILSIDKFLFECDCPHRCDYQKICNILNSYFYTHVENSFHQVWIRKS